MSMLAPLEARLERSSARMGIAIADADGALLASREADEPFPAASVIKLPLVMALYAEAAAGRVSLDERVSVGPRVDGTGVLRHLRNVDALTLRDHAMLACIVSDNTATNRLIERVSFDVVNAYLDRWGCPRTRLERAMYDVDAARRGCDNVMTAHDAVRLLGMLLAGGLVDRATCDAVLDLFAQNTDRTRLRRYLPEADDLWVAHKEGNVTGVRNDAGVIRVRETSIVVAGFCRDLPTPQEGDALLGLLGWIAFRTAGGDGPEPPALV